MGFTANFQIEKPDWKTLRFDTALNEGFDRIDLGFLCWADAVEPGDVAHAYPDIVLAEGCLWRDLTNNVLKVYGAAAWESILSSTALTEVNASGSTDLTTWADLIDAGDGADPRYAIAVKIDSTTVYIPCFTAV